MTSPLQRSALAAALVFSLGGAFAQYGGAGTSASGRQTAPAAQPGAGTRNTESTKDDKVARGDRKFMQEAAEGGMFEAEVSQLAATRAKDPKVKEFASMLHDQHNKANDELTKLANAKGVELPAAPPRAKRNDIEKFGKKQGDEFDRDFVRDVGIKDHEKVIKEFEKASKDVKDPELKAWVTKTLPTLKEHLASAQKLPQAGGKGSGADDASKMGAGGEHGGATTRTGGGSGANKTGS